MLRRNDTMRLGNSRGLGFGEEPFNYEYRSKGTTSQLPLGHSDDTNEIHHVFGLQDQLRPFVEGLNEAEQDAIIRVFNDNGVRVSNDPRNLISVAEKPHDEIHEDLQSVGLDTAGRKEDLEFWNRVSALPFQERLKAARIYATEIFPGLVQRMHALGHQVATPAENIAYNKELIEKERNYELKEHLRDVIEAEPALNAKGKLIKGDEAKAKVYLERLEGVSPPKERKLSSKQMQAQKYKDDYTKKIEDILNEEGPGDNRGKSIVINADTVNLGDARVNGNGKRNGNGNGKQ